MTSCWRRRFALLAAAVTVCAAGIICGAVPAAAKPVLKVAYKAHGQSTVAKPGSTIALGPTTLTVSLNKDGSFTGAMPMPPTSTEFAILGLLPVKATVTFRQVAKLTGKLRGKPKLSVSATARYVLKLSNVTVGGLPTPVGSTCQTSSAVVIPVATPAGKSFNIEKGGKLVGTYTIPSFANCGLTTALINQLVPGPNNTVSLVLRNGHVVS